MPTWKRILTTSDVTNNNIGSSNLFVEDNGALSTRVLKLDTMSIFEVHNSSDQPFLTLGGTVSTLGGTNIGTAKMVSGPTGASFETNSSNTVNSEATNTFKIESTNAANSHYPIFKLAKDVAGGSVVDGYKGPKMAMTCASDNGTEKEVMAISSSVSDATNNGMCADVDFALRTENGMKTFLSAKGGTDGFGLHVKLEVDGDDFIISSDQVNIQASPDLILRKGDTGVQDGENLGTIQFEGYNNASDPELVNYVSVRGEIDEIDDGIEGGRFAVDVMSSGTMKEAFLINGDGLTLDAEFQQTTFRLNGFSNLASEAPTLELNRERTNAPSANDEIGRVLFAGEDSGQARVEYAEIQGKIIDPAAADMDGRLNVSVSKAGSMTEVVGVTHNGGGSASVADSENEQKLKGVELHGTDLEVLTRRNLITIQVGENGTITATDGAVANPALRMANGVQGILGTDMSGSHGIVLPFDGFVVGGSFMCRRLSGASQEAALSMFMRRVFDTDYHDIRVAAKTGTSLGAIIKSDNYPITSTAHRTTGDDGFKFSAGDILVPFFQVDAETGDTVEIADVIGQIFIYTESIVA